MWTSETMQSMQSMQGRIAWFGLGLKPKPCKGPSLYRGEVRFAWFPGGVSVTAAATRNHAKVAVLAARIVDGERKLTAIKSVWCVVEPLYGKWLGLLADYERLVPKGGEAE